MNLILAFTMILRVYDWVPSAIPEVHYIAGFASLQECEDYGRLLKRNEWAELRRLVIYDCTETI